MFCHISHLVPQLVQPWVIKCISLINVMIFQSVAVQRPGVLFPIHSILCQNNCKQVKLYVRLYISHYDFNYQFYSQHKNTFFPSIFLIATGIWHMSTKNCSSSLFIGVFNVKTFINQTKQSNLTIKIAPELGFSLSILVQPFCFQFFPLKLVFLLDLQVTVQFWQPHRCKLHLKQNRRWTGALMLKRAVI